MLIAPSTKNSPALIPFTVAKELSTSDAETVGATISIKACSATAKADSINRPIEPLFFRAVEVTVSAIAFVPEPPVWFSIVFKILSDE